MSQSMATKYGEVKTERKKIPKDEPVFLLRAQDKLAASAVRHYAILRASIGDLEGAKQCHDFAEIMEAWPTKKMPD